jgi:hypothetical protein
MAKSDKVHKKKGGNVEAKANTIVTKPEKVKDDKKKKDKKVTPLVNVPVSSKEILAKAVSILSFTFILGLNHFLRKRSLPRMPMAKCVIITKFYL